MSNHIAILLAVFAVHTCLAQSDTIRAIILPETVVTGQYAASSTEKSVYKIKVIDADEIKARSSATLKDLLSTELGFRVTNDAVLGSATTIQGVSAENIKIMIDGVPLTGRLDGNIDLGQINLTNVERIEIVEGSQSVNYGSNALGGVINLITKKQVEHQINAYYETVGRYHFDGKTGYQFNDYHKVNLFAGRSFFQGFNRPDTSRAKIWKPKENYFADMNYSFDFLNRHHLSLQSNSSYETLIDRGEPYNPPDKTLAFDNYYYTSRLTNSVEYRWEGVEEKNLSTTLGNSYYFRKKRKVKKDLTTLSETPTADQAQPDEYSSFILRSTYSFPVDQKNLFCQTGMEANADLASGGKVKDGAKRQIDISIFGSAEYNLLSDKLKLRPGLRLIYNSLYQAPLVFALSIKYKTSDRLSFRASYANGFRAPSLRDLYFEFKDSNHNIEGNEDLKAERSHNVTLNASFVRAFGNKIYKAETGLYYNLITDLITLAQLEPLKFRYVNIGKYRASGVQFSNELVMAGFKLYAGVSLTYLIATNFGQYDKVVNPQANGGFSYIVPKTKLRLNVLYKYDRNLPYFSALNDRVNLEETDDYHLLDAAVARYFWKERVEASIGVKNIFDVTSVRTGSESSVNVHSGSGVTLVGTGRVYFMKVRINI